MVLETQPAIKALVGVVLVAIARMMDMNEAQGAADQYGIGDGKPSGPLLTIASAGTPGKTKAFAHRGRAPRSQIKRDSRRIHGLDRWAFFAQRERERERERESVCVCVVPAASSRGSCDHTTASVGDLEKL